MKTEKPPADLSPAGKRLWRKIHDEMTVDAPALLLLDSVCEQWDRLQQARKIIAAEGLIVKEMTAANQVKLRAHPACAIETAAVAAMMRAWRLLGFDQQPPGVS